MYLVVDLLRTKWNETKRCEITNAQNKSLQPNAWLMTTKIISQNCMFLFHVVILKRSRLFDRWRMWREREKTSDGDGGGRKTESDKTCTYKNDHLLCFFLTGNGGGWSNSSLPKWFIRRGSIMLWCFVWFIGMNIMWLKTQAHWNREI